MPVKLFGLRKSAELGRSQQADLSSDVLAMPPSAPMLMTRRNIPQPLMKDRTFGNLGQQTDIVEGGGALRNQLLGKVDLRKRMNKMVNKKQEDERIKF